MKRLVTGVRLVLKVRVLGAENELDSLFTPLIVASTEESNMSVRGGGEKRRKKKIRGVVRRLWTPSPCHRE